MITRRGDLGPTEAGVFLQFSRLGPTWRFGCKILCTFLCRGARVMQEVIGVCGRGGSRPAASARPGLLTSGNGLPRATLMAIGHPNWSVLQSHAPTERRHFGSSFQHPADGAAAAADERLGRALHTTAITSGSRLNLFAGLEPETPCRRTLALVLLGSR